MVGWIERASACPPWASHSGNPNVGPIDDPIAWPIIGPIPGPIPNDGISSDSLAAAPSAGLSTIPSACVVIFIFAHSRSWASLGDKQPLCQQVKDLP